MKITNNEKIYFKGFSNIVSYAIQTPEQRYMYMAMKLDDTCNVPDLTNYKRLCHDIGYLQMCDSDVVSFTYKCNNNAEEELYMNNYQLYLDEKLTQMKEKFGYDNYVQSQLKVYTFLADLTKRISNINLVTRNPKTLIDVVENYIREQNLKFADNTTKFYFYNSSINSTTAPLQQVAHEFNKGIHHTMKRFLRV